MKIQEKYNVIKSLVTSTLQELKQAYFKALLKRFPKGDAIFNKSNELQFKSGSFYKSFKAIIKQTGINGQIRIESDFPGSRIHETGGFIQAKRTKLRGKKQIYMMAQYFWFKYLTTRREEYKIIALSVMLKGGVKIPKREYITRTNKEFGSSFEAIKNEFVKKFINVFDT